MKDFFLPEKVLLKKLKELESAEEEEKEIDDIVSQPHYSEAFVKELIQRNKVLLEALRKVKLLVEKLLQQNRKLKVRIEKLEEAFKTKNGKGVKIISAVRYNEMQRNADELSRSLPKLIKLIKLLNQENQLLKEKYAALESEFQDIIEERNDLKEKIRLLNERNQRQVLEELTELFPSTAEAAKVAEALSNSVEPPTPIKPQAETISLSQRAESFQRQALADLQNVGNFDNEQIAKLVELVMEINKKIENLSSNMVVVPQRSRRRAELDLAASIGEGKLEKPEEPPERPDLEEILDDILITSD